MLELAQAKLLIPSVQEHSYDPTLFVHVCSHPPLPVAHSSTSDDASASVNALLVTTFIASTATAVEACSAAVVVKVICEKETLMTVLMTRIIPWASSISK